MKGRRRDWGESSARGDHSWHALRKQTNQAHGVKSRTVQRRQVLLYLKRAVVGIVYIALIGGLALWVGAQLKEDGKAGALVDSKPLAEIRYKTNGVLSEARLARIIHVPAGTRLIDVDIYAIKAKLESYQQVASAVVQRELPDTLRITLVEHQPVMRMVIESGTGSKELRLVSRTGEIFEGLDQDASVIRSLPYLGPFLYPNGTYKPLRGIETVTDLLDTCRLNFPEEYQTWKVVSLKHYRGEAGLPGEVIELLSKEGESTVRLIFSANLDFRLQLDRLRHIREVARGLRDSLERVDLSLNNAAAVKFKSGRDKLLGTSGNLP